MKPLLIRIGNIELATKYAKYDVDNTIIKTDYVNKVSNDTKCNPLYLKVTKSLIYTINYVRFALPFIYYFTM